MSNRTSRMFSVAILSLSICASAIVGNAHAKANLQNMLTASVVRTVRHELATLPYYGVFDWLEFQTLPDNTIVLRGQVVRPTTKSEAEARVKDIDGVSKVVNEIQVLPPSPSDDRLRIALYRAIYDWNSPLFRYATQSIPPIHIIVDRGHATLRGIVATKADAQIAYMRARAVPGLFDVTNELQIESEMPQIKTV